MTNKPKNKMLFVIFILVIISTISILVLSVYNVKQNGSEEYKISSNNSLYDANYSYISLDSDSVLKKEWDNNYYLYDGEVKYTLGESAVFYNTQKRAVTIYGDVYQISSNGDVAEKNGKTEIGDLNEFKFFKLADRKYLIIGTNISNEYLSTTFNYLIVSIDKGGHALLANNDLNIKVVNPLVLNIGNISFDVANEKLVYGKDEIDLKKINGSTNEYVVVEEETEEENIDWNSISSKNVTYSEMEGVANNINNIIGQVISVSDALVNKISKSSLFNAIKLSSVQIGATYVDVNYYVVDPENKFLNIYLDLYDLSNEETVSTKYYLNPNSTSYRIGGLEPNHDYRIVLNYIPSAERDRTVVADSMYVETSVDPTTVRISKIVSKIDDEKYEFYYIVKMFSQYEFESAKVRLDNCGGSQLLGETSIDKNLALSSEGFQGAFEVLKSDITDNNFLCLTIVNAKNEYDDDVPVKGYHKIKWN